MLLIDLMEQTKDILQDTDSDYWSESELVDYFNNGVRTLAAERKEEPTTTTVTAYTDTNEYAVDGVLRYISAVDSNNLERKLYPDDKSGDDDYYGIIIRDYDTIYVNNPLDDTPLSIKTITMPEAVNLDSEVRVGDESALKYFALSKAYEKESDVENFQKAQYFFQLYQRELALLLKNSKSGYIDNTGLVKGWFY